MRFFTWKAAAAAVCLVLTHGELRAQTGTGGSAAGGSAVGGSARGGDARGGDAVGGSARGGIVVGGSAVGGSATSGSATATAGSATAGVAAPGTATAHVAGRSITATAEDGVSIRSQNGRAIVHLGQQHTLVIDRDDVLVDGERRASLHPSTDQVRITFRGGHLTVRAGEAEILADDLR